MSDIDRNTFSTASSRPDSVPPTSPAPTSFYFSPNQQSDTSSLSSEQSNLPDPTDDQSTLEKVLEGVALRAASPVSFHFSSDQAGNSRPLLGGVIDVVCLYDEQSRELVSISPLWLQFGSASFRSCTGRWVVVEVNGKQTGIRLKLDSRGVAAFVDDSLDPSFVSEHVGLDICPPEELPFHNEETIEQESISPPKPSTTAGDLLVSSALPKKKSKLKRIFSKTKTHSPVASCSDEFECRKVVWGKNGKYSFPPEIIHRLKDFLLPGPNVVRYHALSRASNKPRSTIGGFIYLWPTSRKYVVFDIDGTITGSDLFGFLGPAMRMGKWVRRGVVSVVNYIVDKGYLPIYLTMRGLPLAGQTRKYLQHTVREGGKHLPPGPVITCTLSIMDAGRIAPDEYKSFAMESLTKALNPKKALAEGKFFFEIWAGFGNRETDTKAYLRSGINPSRIFYFGSELSTDGNVWKDYVELVKSGYLTSHFPVYLEQRHAIASTSELLSESEND
ncbi:hypothetical protein RCL1_003481 [Eukaryota sp. TZLM3-RCL]